MALNVVSFLPTLANESILVAWYTVYMNDYYNCNIIVSTVHLSVMSVIVLVSSQMVRIQFKKIQQNQRDNSVSNQSRKIYDFKHFLVICALLSVTIDIIFSFFIIPSNLLGFNYQYSFCIYFIIIGIAFGVYFNCQETMITEIQPKQHSGKISGVRGFLSFNSRALGMLIVALTWDIDIQYFWYVRGYFYCITLVAIIIVAVLETCRNYK